MMAWQIIYDPKEGDEVVFLGVHALRWPSYLEPTVAFYDDYGPDVDELREQNIQLLDACKVVLPLMEVICSQDVVCDAVEEYDHAISLLITAIAKAEGNS